jgi:hypothetical protein
MKSSMNWPEAAVVVAFIAFLAFWVWLIWG